MNLKHFLSLLISLIIFSGCSKKESPPFKYILLIVVDTMAVDYLGAYNPNRSATPNIDKLATRGVLFERAYSPAPWTKPAVSSIFTGVFPSVHGVRSINDKLPHEFETLAERLKHHGFKTGGVVSHTLISPEMGYAQGFDTYDIISYKGNIHNVVSSAKVTEMGIEWLKNHIVGGSSKVDSDQNTFFLFLHYFDPHNNYFHHKKFDRTSWYKGDLKPGMDIRELRKKIPNMSSDDIKYLKGLYEEEIAYTDYEIGKFLDYFETLEQAKDTLIIFTVDHGEEFLERNTIGHSNTLYDELIKVPLIFVPPTQGGSSSDKKFVVDRIKDPVSTMDIMPTVLDLLNEKPKSKFNGVSLKDLLYGGARQSAGNVFSEVDFKSSYIKANKISLVRDNLKLILDKPTGNFELYDLLQDPAEKKNLFEEFKESEEVRSLLLLIKAYEDDFQKGGVQETKPLERSPEELEQLKSLGYL